MSSLKTPLELIQLSAPWLAERGIENARLDAELLLAHVLKTNRLGLYIEHERPVVGTELARFRELLRQRGQRIPLQLLLGNAQFLDHEFELRPGVFIPRPETEVLVLRTMELEFSSGAPDCIVELGTGSGIVGLSLLKHWPKVRLIGWEIEATAHALTLENARQLGVEDRLELHLGDALDAEWPACDLLVSNPPYLAEAELAGLEAEVRDHDPPQALHCGEDALRILRALILRGVDALRPGGWIALEHAPDQGGALAELFSEAGYRDARLEEDLTGRPRLSLARR